MTKIAMRFVTTTDIPIGDALVAIRLTRSDYEEKTSGVIMTRLEEFHTDADGFLQVDLLPAKALYHVTVYDTVQDIAIHHDFIVPEVEDPNAVLLLPDLIVPPDTVLSSLPYDEEALAKIIQAKVEAIAARDASRLAATQSEASANAAATSATAASASKTAAANSAIAALAAQTNAAQSAATATTAATTATTAKTDSLAYRDQAFQYMTTAQAAKGNAEGSAGAAFVSANLAANSATAATGAATTSTGARDVAVDAKNKAETAWTDFDKRYFGAFAANPATNAHGAAPVVGSLYWNTTTKTLFVWTGAAWYEITLAYRTAQNRKIVVFGSSVAYGYGSPSWNGWATRLSVAMTARGYTMVNKSIGGDTTAALINRFYTDVVSENPGIVIIGLSLANEGLMTYNRVVVYNQYIAGIRRLVAMCREMGYKVVVTGVYSNNDYTAADYPYLIQADQELEYSDIPYINFLGAVDDGTGKWRTGMWTDAGHPNDVGHEALFRAFPLSLFDNLSTGRSSNIQVVNPNIMKIDAMVNDQVPVVYTSESPFGSFTLMARIRRTSLGAGGKPLIALESSTNAYQAFRIRNQVDALAVSADATDIITSSVLTSTGKELCLILSFDYFTNMWRFWIDGVLIGSAVYAPVQAINYDQIAFGGRTNFAGFNVNGYEYSDMAVWRSALTAEQVAEATAGRINKASLNMYAPVVDALVPMNYNLVNLAPSSTYGRVSATGITTYPRNVTASDVATPNALVKTQANGYINTALLDSNTAIKTQMPISFGMGAANKFGYNYLQQGQGQRLYKIATLEPSASSTYSSLRIDAMIGGWGAYDLTAMTILIGSRVSTQVEGVNVEWSSSRYIPVTVRFLAYLEPDNKVSVYLFFLAGGFAQASFNLMGMQATTYEAPVAVSSVPGTPVWDSSAGPGEALYRSPRSRGMGNAPATLLGTSFDSLVEVRAQDGNTSATSYLAGAQKTDATAAGADVEVLRHGVAGNSGVNFSGFMQWLVSAGTSGTFKTGYKLSLKARDTGSGTATNTLFSVSGTGLVYAQWLKAGSASTRAVHTMNATAVQFGEIMEVGREGSASSCMAIRASDGLGGWNNAQSVMYIGKNSTTNRGVASPGTFNAQGTDYAEYFVKALYCGLVVAGQLVGVDSKNQVTDLWAEAVMFAIKSTDPSFVGGDSWGMHLGNRPSSLAGAKPTAPARIHDVMGTNPEDVDGDQVVTTPGDTDEEWEAKMADFDTTVVAWEQAVEADHLAQADFDAKLEEARARVDRIAIAGRVPVNVQGAQPGDYIVPVQDGEGIKGIAVKEDDMTLRLYLRAVGQVITIEEDGRAYVMVKSV